MRREVAVAALIVVGFGGFAASARATEIPIDKLSLPVPKDKQVRVDFPVGQFHVEAADDNRITFDLSARCKGWRSSRCEERAERIRLESEDADGTLKFKVRGYPKGDNGGLHLRGVLHLPRELALHVDMGVGELRINDVEGDLDVDLGVGDADIRTTKHSVRSVDVATGVGDATVHADGGRVRRHGFLGSTASWDEGRGRATVNLHVGVGEATVRVE